MNPIPDDQGRKRSRLYLRLAMGAFLLMAFLSAIDISFVYLFTAVALGFLMLAIWHRPSASRGSETSERARRRNHESKGAQQSPAPTSASKVIRVLSIVFGGLFFFFMVIGFIAGDDESTAAYYSKAEEFRALQQVDSAKYYYRKILAIDPEYLGALNGIGILWLNERRYDSALYYFDRTLALDDEYEHGRYNKALVFYYQRDFSRALKEAMELVAINPYYNEGLQLMGDIFYEQKNNDAAREWYDRAYENGHRNAWLCHVLGYLYDTKGDTQRAIALYQEAVSYDPYRVDVFTRLGELLPGADGEQYRMTAQQLRKDGY